MMQITARELSTLLAGTLTGNPEVIITHPSKIEESAEGAITFLANPKYENYLYSAKASAILVQNGFQPHQEVSMTMIAVDNVYQALGQVLQYFNSGNGLVREVSSLAVVDPSAQIGENTGVGPLAFIGKQVKIGRNCLIYPQVYIGDNSEIGDDCILYPGVVIYHDNRIGQRCILHAHAVVGSDGFGFAETTKGYQKIPQIGNVIIENDVEIGAGTAIDRATMGSTIIRSGSKLDNLIQIAHNVELGEQTVIAAQAGIAGSTKVGRRVKIGGQAGLVGHLQVADGTMIQAQSGLATNVDVPGSKYHGTPAMNYQDFMRSYVYFRQLPDLVARLETLEKQRRKDPDTI